MRPRQWSKNVFVFAGIFFDGRILDGVRLLRSVIAFVIFCLLSSAVYLVNDIADVERDRLHPAKKNRPIASGALRPQTAALAAAIIVLVCLPVSFVMDRGFGGIALLYVGSMVFYSFVLKNVVIIDVMVVAAGFVLRVFAGTVVSQVTRFSPWLYVCTTLLALFVAINKRRRKRILLAENANSHRASLQEYSQPFLDKLSSLVVSTTLACYSFYTFSAPNLPKNHAMMLTIPIVMYGMFRYLYLTEERDLGGAPEDVFLGDLPLIIAGALWALVSAVVIYLPT